VDWYTCARVSEERGDGDSSWRVRVGMLLCWQIHEEEEIREVSLAEK